MNKKKEAGLLLYMMIQTHKYLRKNETTNSETTWEYTGCGDNVTQRDSDNIYTGD